MADSIARSKQYCCTATHNVHPLLQIHTDLQPCLELLELCRCGFAFSQWQGRCEDALRTGAGGGISKAEEAYLCDILFSLLPFPPDGEAHNMGCGIEMGPNRSPITIVIKQPRPHPRIRDKLKGTRIQRIVQEAAELRYLTTVCGGVGRARLRKDPDQIFDFLCRVRSAAAC